MMNFLSADAIVPEAPLAPPVEELELPERLESMLDPEPVEELEPMPDDELEPIPDVDPEPWLDWLEPVPDEPDPEPPEPEPDCPIDELPDEPVPEPAVPCGAATAIEAARTIAAALIKPVCSFIEVPRSVE